MKIMTYEQLKELKAREEDFLLVNVLKLDIPGSVQIPKTQPDFESRVEQVAGDKQRTVVVYCSDYECSASRSAAKKLENAGFADVYAYEGGIHEWQEKSAEAN